MASMLFAFCLHRTSILPYQTPLSRFLLFVAFMHSRILFFSIKNQTWINLVCGKSQTFIKRRELNLKFLYFCFSDEKHGKESKIFEKTKLKSWKNFLHVKKVSLNNNGQNTCRSPIIKCSTHFETMMRHTIQIKKKT